MNRNVVYPASAYQRREKSFFISQRAVCKSATTTTVTFKDDNNKEKELLKQNESFNLLHSGGTHSIWLTDSNSNHNHFKANTCEKSSPLQIKRKHEQRIRTAQSMYLHTGKTSQNNYNSTTADSHAEQSQERKKSSKSDMLRRRSYRHLNFNKRQSGIKPNVRDELKYICYKISVGKRILQVLKERSIESTMFAPHIEQYFAFRKTTLTDLIFNVDDFKKGNLKSRLPLWSRRILVMDPSERSQKDCRSLQALLKSTHWFEQFAEEVQIALCKSINFISVEAQRIIVRKGHVPTYLYVLYSGSVFSITEDADGYVDTVILKKGESFGEMSLLSGTLRENTVIGREPSEILYMDKESFLSACSRIFQEEVQQKKAFIQSMELFSHYSWTPEIIHKLSIEAQILRFKTDAIITMKTADDDDWMYVCMQGSCKVYQEKFLRNTTHLHNLDKSKRKVSIASSLMSNNDAAMWGVYTKDEVIDILEEKFDNDCTEIERIMALPKVEVLSIIEKYLHEKEAQAHDLFLGNEGAQLFLQKIAYKQSELSRKLKQKSKFHKELVNARHVSAEPKSAVPTVATKEPENLTELLIERRGHQEGPIVLCMIHVLHQGYIYDLSAVLNSLNKDVNRDRKKNRSKIKNLKTERRVLVSNTCQIIKIRKNTFFRYCYGSALDHAKHCAEEDEYVNKEELEQCVKTKSDWALYKQSLVTDLMTPSLRSRKREYVNHKTIVEHLQEVSIFQQFS